MIKQNKRKLTEDDFQDYAGYSLILSIIACIIAAILGGHSWALLTLGIGGIITGIMIVLGNLQKLCGIFLLFSGLIMVIYGIGIAIT